MHSILLYIVIILTFPDLVELHIVFKWTSEVNLSCKYCQCFLGFILIFVHILVVSACT